MNSTNAASSIYELAFNLINKNYTEIDDSTKRNIIRKIREVLNNGATYNSINSKIQTSSILGGDYIGYLNSTKTSSCINLIDQREFYYHNELRVYPEPPEVEFDINTGECKRAPFEYFLEIKASYTIEDLYNYIQSKSSMRLILNNRNRLMGGLTSLLQKYKIEKILFMIDTTDFIYDCRNRLMKSIFEIEEYAHESLDSYNLKMSESIGNGTNKVILKKRKLFEEKSEM